MSDRRNPKASRPGGGGPGHGGRVAARRGPARSDGLIALGLFALAAAVRLLFLRGTVDRTLPFSLFYYGDSRLYREYALAILRGELFDEGIPFHPPLFAHLLAGVIRFTGEDPFAVRAILAVLGALAVPLAYLLGATVWNRRVAIVGSILATFSFGLGIAAISPNVETVYLPLLLAETLVLVLLVRATEGAQERDRAGGRSQAAARGSFGPRDTAGREAHGGTLAMIAAWGALHGLGSLARAEHLALALALPAALLLGRPRPGLGRVARVTLGGWGIAALLVAPWTARNFFAISRFNHANPTLAEPLPRLVPVTSYGPLNFVLANGPGADGTFKPDRIAGKGGGANLDLRNPEHLDLYLHGYGKGLSWLARDPRESARLVGRKLGVAAEAGALGFGLSNWPAGLTGTRRAVDLFSPDRKLLLPIALLVLASGIVTARGAWRRASPLWLAVLHKTLVCAAFYGYVRMFVQILPFVFLVQACGLVALGSRIPRPAIRRLLAGLGLAITAALLVELVAAGSRPRNFTVDGSSDPATGKIIQDAELRIAPAPASVQGSRGLREVAPLQ